MKLVGIGFFSYLIGCITAGYFIGRLFYKADIRKSGSGNLGTTNALRTLGKRAGAVTLTIDLLKGWAAVFLATMIEPVWGPYVAAIFVVLGHNFPFHLQFRGGKGVATSAGALLAFSPLLIGLMIAFFALVVIISKRVSLGSISAAALAPFVAWVVTHDPKMVAVTSFLAVLLILRHHANIRRLLNGEEKPITFGRRKP